MGYINSPASFLVLSAGFCLVMPFFSLSTGISRGETKEGQTLVSLSASRNTVGEVSK